MWLDSILGLFVRVNEYSYFPFISWIVFPVAGFGFAHFCQKCGKKKTLVLAALTGTAALIVSSVLVRALGMPDATIVDVVEVRDEVYYSLHPLYALSGYGIIMLEFIFAYFILRITHNRMPGSLLTMSKNVTQIYIIQWAAIALLSPLPVAFTSIWVNMALALVVLVISCFGGMWLKKTNLIRV